MSATRTVLLRRHRRRREQHHVGPSIRVRMLLALMLVASVLTVGIGLLTGGSALYAMNRYSEIAEGVVPPEQLIAEQSRGGARILDRHGVLLYEFVDDLSGLRRPVPLVRISDRLIHATIAVEDPTFYENNGLNARGLTRAAVENFAPFLLGEDGDLLEGSGGSSITQQLAKNIYIPREERTERSVERKVKETVIALELTKRYSKDQLLEWYLNSISYGGIYTGIEAAAQGYFDKPASELTLSEASLLAGIPQSPALYNPFSPENFDAETRQLSPTSSAKARQAEVLHLMAARGYITPEEATAALDEDLHFRQAQFEIDAPHFVLGRIADEVRARFGERALYDQGLVVTTTLDLNLQRIAEDVVERYVFEYGEQANLFNGAFVAMDPRRGEILAYVGSRDYFRDDIEGRNDNAVALNSPGSTLKPFTFMTAFMRGWGTGTAVIAAPFTLVDETNGDEFKPRDPIQQVLGPIPAAKALGNSLNTTAIRTILFAGVPETIDTLKRVGFTTFDDPTRFGPALTTGGSEVTLVDMVYAYSVLSTNGVMRGAEAAATPRLDADERSLEPAAILQIADSDGRVLWEYTPEEQQVVEAPYAYLVTSILSDGSNQCITYGVCDALALPNGYPSAAKTGTSEPFDDDSKDIGETWTIGYTPELVAGIWAGNADNARIQGITSTTVSLRGWKDFMAQALEYLELPPTPFERPEGVVSEEVCWPSGKLPTPACPQARRYTSLYAAEVIPKDPTTLSEEDRARLYDTWWQPVSIDARTGTRPTSSAPSEFVSRSARLVIPQEELLGWDGFPSWAAANGVSAWVGVPPSASSVSGMSVSIANPGPNASLSGLVSVRGSATSPDFLRYRLEWGRGNSPSSWSRITSGSDEVSSGILGQWNTRSLTDGTYTLRLVLEDRTVGERYFQIPVQVDQSSPTPTNPSGATGTPSGPDPTPSASGEDAPVVVLETPATGATVQGAVTIGGTAASAYPIETRVEVASAASPSSWSVVAVYHEEMLATGTLATWDTSGLEPGGYLVRLVVVDRAYGTVVRQTQVVVP